MILGACAACVLLCAGAGAVYAASADDGYSPLGGLLTLMGQADKQFSEGGLVYVVTTKDGEAPTVQVGTTGTMNSKATALVDAVLTTQVNIPSVVEHDGVSYSVTSIADYAFAECDLESIAIAPTVTSIGNYAFFKDGKLASVQFADGSQLTSIGTGAFAMGNSVTELNLQDEAAVKPALTSITFPASLNILETRAFFGQSSLKEAVFQGDTIYSVSTFVFAYCTSLESIEIPTILTESRRVGASSFIGDVSLKTVKFHGGVANSPSITSGFSNEFSGCTGIQDVVYYDKKWTMIKAGITNPGTSYGQDANEFAFSDSPLANEYYTVKQYATEEDALAGVNCLGEIQVLRDTPLWKINAGELGERVRSVSYDKDGTTVTENVTSAEAYSQNGYQPGAWRYEGSENLGSPLTDSVYAVPVEADGLLSLERGGMTIEGEYIDGTLQTITVDKEGAEGSSDDETEDINQYVMKDGPVDLGVKVYDAAGALLVEGRDYVVTYESGDASYEDMPTAPGIYRVRVTGIGSYSGSLSLRFSLAEYLLSWTRVTGLDAVSTAQAISKKAILSVSQGGTPSGWAVVAADDDTLGALAASSLAGALDAPVLLTDGETLSTETATELNRVRAQRVVIVGSSSKVSESVQAAIKDLYVVQDVYRISANNPYDTAAKIATLGCGITIGATWSDTCIVAPRDNLALVQVAAAYANLTASPLFLVDAEAGLSQSELDAMATCSLARAIVLGDESVISADVDAQLKSVGVARQRIAADTDERISLSLAEFTLTETTRSEEQGVTPVAHIDGLAVASASNVASVPTASTLSGRTGTLLVLVGDGSEAYDFIASHKYEITYGYILGGGDGVTTSQAERIDSI